MAEVVQQSESVVEDAGRPRVATPFVIAFAASGVPVAMIGLLIAIYLPPFYAGQSGLSLLAVAGVFSAVRAIDIVLDVMLGLAMDRTRTPIGRYRPWLALSIPLLMLPVWMLLTPASHGSSAYLFVWLLMLYAALSVATLSQAAWAGSLATDYHDRSRVYGWMAAIAVIGTLSLPLMPFITKGAITPGDPRSMYSIGVIVLTAILVGTLAAVLFTPERVSQNRHESVFPWREYLKAIGRPSMIRIILADLFLSLGPGTLLPMYIFFFKDVKAFPLKEINLLLVPLIAAALFGSPFAARVARRFGKHRTLVGATVAFGVAQTILMLMPKGNLGITALGMFLVGFSSAGFTPLLRAMVADVADEVRLEQNKEQLGLLYAMVTTTSKIGSGISVAIAYFILQNVGYKADPKAVNTPEAIFGLQMTYLFAPILLVALGGVCLLGYALDEKKHAAIRAALDARDRGEAIT